MDAIESEVERKEEVIQDLKNWLARKDAEIAQLRAENDRKDAALIRLRDCDWIITLPDRMDAVRKIAREALSPPSERDATQEGR